VYPAEEKSHRQLSEYYEPTKAPAKEPTKYPTISPSKEPSKYPTMAPTTKPEPVYKPYCLYTLKIDYEKEIEYYEKYHDKIVCEYDAEVALQGVGSIGGESTQLITAAAGEFAGFEGSLTMAPTEKYPEVIKAELTFA
jgi:hypothetical protein